MAANASRGYAPYRVARLATPTSNATGLHRSPQWYLEPDARVRYAADEEDPALSEAVIDESDPFEEFNKAMGAGVIQNPYPDQFPD